MTIKKALKDFVFSAQGNVTVEMALVMSVFALLMVGGYDISNMAVEKHQLEQYARAGTQWGLMNQADASDTATVETKVKDAAGKNATDITVAATNFCECDGSSAGCDSTCDSGEAPDLFLKVIVSRDYNYVFKLPSSWGAVTLVGTSVVRVR